MALDKTWQKSMFIVLLTFLAIYVPFCNAQDSTGIPRYGSFSSHPIDTINLSNLNVHVDIPVFQKKSRGYQTSYDFTYDSTIYTSYADENDAEGVYPPDSFAWGITHRLPGPSGVTFTTTPALCDPLNEPNGPYAYTYGDYVSVDQNNTPHQFNIYTVDESQCGGNITTASGYAADGSGYYLTATGSQYSITDLGGLTATYAKASPVDTNGNITSNPAPSQLEDSSGAIVTETYAQYPPTNGSGYTEILTYTDSNGQSQNIVVTYTPFQILAKVAADSSQVYGPTQAYLPTNIALPDGTSYQFTFEITPGNPGYTTGRLASITLPTGGVVNYQYTGGYNGFLIDGYVGSGIVGTAGIVRTTSDGATTYSRTVTIHPDCTNIPCETVETQVQDAQGNQTVVDFASSGESGMLRETKRRIYQGNSSSGTLLLTTMRCYNGTSGDCTTQFIPPVTQDVSEIDVTSTPEGGTSSRQTTFYNAKSLKTEFDEYDYGATSPTRKTLTSYASLGNNIQNRPQVVTVYNSAGNVAQQTTYGYDENGLVSTSGLPNHIVVSGARGNLTSIGQLVTGQTNITTQTMTYDDAGQVVAIKDGDGNTTTYGHDSSDTFVTLVTRPTTNGVNHISSAGYDLNTGMMISSTDENMQTTAYSYDERMRPKQINYPDDGKTSYSYTPTSATQQISESGSSTLNTTVDLDGYGRTVHVYSPNGSVVDTSYDADGRVGSTSNPHDSSGSPTDGTTFYSYDSLNRMTQQTNQDGSTEKWSYNGNTFTFTDEVGNSWTRTVDALGRLTNVVEPNGGTATAYSYDALDDLIGVVQGSEYRSFTYDDVPRLLTSTNPESGTITYNTYDSNSNLLKKTDARGIATTYSYDTLNRMTGKTYSDSTYPVTYIYDTSSGPNPMNTIGRLTDEKTTVQGSIMTERAIDQYDAMGRELSERQCFVGGCGATAYTLSHQYDLAGNIILSNNGLPAANTNAATLSYGYNGDGQLQSVSSTLNDATHPQVLFQAQQYGPIGLTQANYAIPIVGAAFGFSQSLAYDNRTRLTGETDSVTTPTPSTLYSYNVDYFSNGNLHDVTDSEMGTWGYTYDGVNRLHTAVSTAGVYTGLTLTEAYDVFGNRSSQTASGTYGGMVPQPGPVTFNNNNNRVDQWSYDAAGEVLNDTNNMYEYDAEGRQTGTLNSSTGLTGYVYDAEGRRVMKVVVNNFGTPQASTTVENEYLLGLNDEQVTVLNGYGQWQWTNIYAGNKQLATYNNSGTHFTLTDWLGTKRVQLSVTGPSTVTVAEQCSNLPFGDGLSCTGTDVNQLHFTGKQRDAESNNDYFGARYYSSTITGRFLTPDPASLFVADPSNPQTWNQYAYVLNNPLSNVDPAGYDCVYLSFKGTAQDPTNTTSGLEDSLGSENNQKDCQLDGGYWVDGTATSITYYTGSHNVMLTGYTTDSSGNQTPTSAYYVNANGDMSDFITGMGYIGLTGTVDLVQLYQNRPNSATIGPLDPADVDINCAGQAGGSLLKDLTGISTLQDVANAAATGSFSSLTGGDAVDLGSRAASHAAESSAAKNAIKSLAATFGSRISASSAGKMLNAAGELGGKASIAISVVKASMEFGSCAGW